MEREDLSEAGLNYEILNEYGLSDKAVVARYLFAICISVPLTLPFIALLFRVAISIVTSVPGL